MSHPARAITPAPASEPLLRLPEPRTPEGQLMLAVLLDAVALLREDATGRVQHARRDVKAALEWIASDDASWPLSFVRVCRGLGFEPQAYREALRAELAACAERVRGAQVRTFRGPQADGATRSTGSSSR